MDWVALCANADVVGIGEECHGDLVSWRWRIDAVRALSKVGPVAVLCENFDFYVRKARVVHGQTLKFEAHEGQFVPFLMPFSDRMIEHRRACREIAKHATCFGIDVRQMDVEHAPWSWAAAKDVPILGPILGRHRAAWLAASDREKARGDLRNALNGKIVAEMAVALRAAGFTSVLYFAQNEHVGLDVSSNATTLTDGYLTDGYHISQRVKYVAVATCAPRMWNTWSGKMRLDRLKIGRARPWSNKPFAIVATRSEPTKLQLNNYTTDAFDVVIVDARPLRPARSAEALPPYKPAPRRCRGSKGILI